MAENWWDVLGPGWTEQPVRESVHGIPAQSVVRSFGSGRIAITRFWSEQNRFQGSSSFSEDSTEYCSTAEEAMRQIIDTVMRDKPVDQPAWLADLGPGWVLGEARWRSGFEQSAYLQLGEARIKVVMREAHDTPATFVAELICDDDYLMVWEVPRCASPRGAVHALAEAVAVRVEALQKRVQVGTEQLETLRGVLK